MEEHINKYKSKENKLTNDSETPLLPKTTIEKLNTNLNMNNNLNEPLIKPQLRIYDENEYLRHQQSKQIFSENQEINSNETTFYSTKGFKVMTILTIILYAFVIYLVLSYR